MGNLEETFLSEAMFPELTALRFKKEARFLNVTRIGLQNSIIEHDGPVNTVSRTYGDEQMTTVVQ